jgi:hypothetical protein
MARPLGPYPYHLGATRSIEVIDAGQRTLTVIQGRYRAERLLHFAPALPARLLPLNCQEHNRKRRSTLTLKRQAILSWRDASLRV